MLDHPVLPVLGPGGRSPNPKRSTSVLARIPQQRDVCPPPSPSPPVSEHSYLSRQEDLEAPAVTPASRRGLSHQQNSMQEECGPSSMYKTQRRRRTPSSVSPDGREPHQASPSVADMSIFSMSPPSTHKSSVIGSRRSQGVPSSGLSGSGGIEDGVEAGKNEGIEEKGHRLSESPASSGMLSFGRSTIPSCGSASQSGLSAHRYATVDQSTSMISTPESPPRGFSSPSDPARGPLKDVRCDVSSSSSKSSQQVSCPRCIFCVYFLRACPCCADFLPILPACLCVCVFSECVFDVLTSSLAGVTSFLFIFLGFLTFHLLCVSQCL